MSNKQNGQAPKGNLQQTKPSEDQVLEGQGGEVNSVAQLQAKVHELIAENLKISHDLAEVIAERDDLFTRLAEATEKLQAAAAPAKSGNEGKGTHIRVCSKSPGGSHRRAGRVWTAQAVDVPLKALSNEELAQLRSCPLTIVVDL